MNYLLLKNWSDILFFIKNDFFHVESNVPIIPHILSTILFHFHLFYF